MGYDAGYFSYGVSEVYAADMYQIFEGAPRGIMDRDVGRHYRKCILEPGQLTWCG